MKKVLVLGAGISGLATAWFLKKRYGTDIQLTILEKSSRSGGWIETIQKDGFLFELGPRGFRPTGAGIETLRLIEDLDLKDQVIVADPKAHIRYLYCKGTLHAVPTGLGGFLTSSLTRGLVFTMCKEFFTSKGSQKDPSIYDFISYRFNQKVANELMDPLNSGIYAGDIRKLSMQSCFPVFYELEKEYGSVVRGMLFKKKTKKNTTSFIQSLSKESIVSFKKGMQTLTDTLTKNLMEHIRYDCDVLAIKHNTEVNTSQGVFDADYIFSTLPAKKASSLFVIPSVEAVSIAIVNLGYKNAVKMPKGFGYLIPSQEKEKVLGVVWDSQIFPQQNVGDETRLTVMIGGAHMADFHKHDENEFLRIALEAVSKHLDVKEIANSMHVRIAQEAIPQYHVGHASKLQMIKALLPETVTLLGSSYQGVSVNDCIAQASAQAFLPDCKKRTG